MPYATVNGLQIHYEIEGMGPALLLITGTGFPGGTWRTGISARFAREGFRVITYDHRGVGKSDRSDQEYSTRLFAQDAAGLLAALEIDRAHVVGHSMGGRVAQWMALEHAQRLKTVVLAASGPGEFDPSFKVMRGIPLHTAIALIEKGYEGYIRDHIAGPFWFKPDFVREDGEVVRRLADAFWADHPPLRDYLRHVIARQQHQTAERLADIDTPTLVIVGDEDQMTAGTGNHLRQSQYLARQIPNARLVLLSDVAHGFFWERPEETTQAILNFLQEYKE